MTCGEGTREDVRLCIRGDCTDQLERTVACKNDECGNLFVCFNFFLTIDRTQIFEIMYRKYYTFNLYIFSSLEKKNNKCFWC